MLFLIGLLAFAEDPAKVYTVATVDVCRCLNEKGNSPFMKANAKVCDGAISKKLEVPDWNKVNFSTNAAANAKWKKKKKECNNTTSQCMEKEKAKRGCTAKDIKDPRWNTQNCTVALIEALKACEKKQSKSNGMNRPIQ